MTTSWAGQRSTENGHVLPVASIPHIAGLPSDATDTNSLPPLRPTHARTTSAHARVCRYVLISFIPLNLISSSGRRRRLLPYDPK